MAVVLVIVAKQERKRGKERKNKFTEATRSFFKNIEYSTRIDKLNERIYIYLYIYICTKTIMRTANKQKERNQSLLDIRAPCHLCVSRTRSIEISI